MKSTILLVWIVQYLVGLSTASLESVVNQNAVAEANSPENVDLLEKISNGIKLNPLQHLSQNFEIDFLNIPNRILGKLAPPQQESPAKTSRRKKRGIENANKAAKKFGLENNDKETLQYLMALQQNRKSKNYKIDLVKFVGGVLSK
uniref:Uncharacterized protein n=1 Tax=Cacopsylla melanoneura TaxID=428564 RepID=A0A8D9BWR5_9HEMI